jgi:hypothetical protein
LGKLIKAITVPIRRKPRIIEHSALFAGAEVGVTGYFVKNSDLLIGQAANGLSMVEA